MTDDNLKAFENDGAYREDITGVAEAYIRNGNANNYSPAQFAEITLLHTQEEAGRNITPDAFLLDRNDAKYLLKANNIQLNTWVQLLRKAPRGAVQGEIPESKYLDAVQEAFKEGKVGIPRLQKILKKVTGQNFWYYRVADMFFTPADNKGLEYETTVVIDFNGVVHHSYPLEGRGNDILFASDPVERGTLAEIPEGYKYLPYSEYTALIDIRDIVEKLTKANTAEQVLPTNYYEIPSDPVLSAVSSVRTRTTAVELPAFGGGKVIQYVTANGKKIQLTAGEKGLTKVTGNEKPIPIDEIMRAISSPNASKILDYSMSKSVEHGLAKTVTLDADEVMQLQGRTNKQSTIRAMKEGIRTLRSLEVVTQDEDTGRERNIGIYQDYEFPPQGASFKPTITFSDRFYEAMQRATSYAQFDKKIQALTGLKYRIARVIYDHKRASLEHENENDLSMQKIMEYCDLTRDTLKDKGQTRQLIIEPILKAFDELDDAELFYAEFRKPRGKKLTEAELDTIYEHTVDFDLFTQLIVRAHMFDEPDYDKVRRRKRNYIEKAKKAKKQGKK